jgi:hypothetical protein
VKSSWRRFFKAAIGAAFLKTIIVVGVILAAGGGLDAMIGHSVASFSVKAFGYGISTNNVGLAIMIGGVLLASAVVYILTKYGSSKPSGGQVAPAPTTYAPPTCAPSGHKPEGKWKAVATGVIIGVGVTLLISAYVLAVIVNPV